MDGQYSVRRRRRLSAVADGLGRTRSECDFYVGITLPKARIRRVGQGYWHLADRLLRKFQSRPRRIKARNVFPRILDKYVVREFLIIFALVLAGFVTLILVFTVFDLLKDILSHDIGWYTVSEYLINLTPACFTRSPRWPC